MIISLIKKSIVLVIGLTCVLITCSSLIHLVAFLTWNVNRDGSSSDISFKHQEQNGNTVNDHQEVPPSTFDNIHRFKESVNTPLLLNIIIVVMFIAQHSLLASDAVKSIFQRAGGVMYTLQRPFYLLATSVAIELLIYYWNPIDSLVVWHLVDDNLVDYCIKLKIFGWVIISLELITLLDIFEFIGLKQMYNYIIGKEDVEQQQKEKQSTLKNGMRHPNLIGLLILMWSAPRMTLDHLCLCIFFTLYLLIGHSLSDQHHQSIKNKIRIW